MAQHTFPHKRTRGRVGTGTLQSPGTEPCYFVSLSFYLEWPDPKGSVPLPVELVFLSHGYADGTPIAPVISARFEFLSLIAALVPPAKQTAACCLASEITYISRQKGWVTLRYSW